MGFVTFNRHVKAFVTQSCPTFSDPMEDSSVHGILQARILKWIASYSLFHGIFLTQESNPVSFNAEGFFTVWNTREAPLTGKTLLTRWSHNVTMMWLSCIMKVFSVTVEIYSNDKINVEANSFSATTLNSLLEKKQLLKSSCLIGIFYWSFSPLGVETEWLIQGKKLYSSVSQTPRGLIYIPTSNKQRYGQ